MSQRLTMTVLAVVALLPWLRSPARGQQPTASAEDSAMARQLLQQAFDRRYRWDKKLKGFTADFTLNRDHQYLKGSVVVKLTRSRGDIQVICDDEAAKTAVREVLANTVMHTRAATFEDSFGRCSFAPAGVGKFGGTVIQLGGHGFFKDFTVKDGFIVQNHGSAPGFESEVSVHQVAWIAELGKTVPKESSANITTGRGELKVTRTIHTWEDWGPAHGHCFPVRHRSVITVGNENTETLVVFDNIQVETTPEAQ